MSDTFPNPTSDTAENFRRIAKAVLPDWEKLPSVADLEAQYPPRVLGAGAIVTRVGPSPTGMMHLGGLYTALINQRVTEQTGGVFFLRIEDTDQKRTVPGALETIVDSMATYGLNPGEGPVRTPDGAIGEIGKYGPYLQTSRKAIYHAVAFDLICKGLVYPCFKTEEEIEAIRNEQRAQELRAGIYGLWAAASRSIDAAGVEKALAEGRRFVLRLKAFAAEDASISWEDAIRGPMTLPANIMDSVLIKSDGIPTYHFAHLVDDHFMRTTHIIRAEEWLSSVPLHLQLYQAAGWQPPAYGHIAAIYKQHGGSKRKLSKRSDPEADVRFYWENGFPKEAVLEYLTNLANGAFEDWRAANPSAPRTAFQLSLDKMVTGGPLSDLVKLKSTSRGVISRMSGQELYEVALTWAQQFEPALAGPMARDVEYTKSALEVHRVGNDDSKRLFVLADIRVHLAPFFDELLPEPSSLPFPEEMAVEDRMAILTAVASRFDSSVEAAAVFPMVQAIAAELNYAPSTKEYKASPELFKGQVGDVAMVVRVALFGSRKSPDLGQLMTVLGPERVRRRVQRVTDASLTAPSSGNLPIA